MNWEVINCRSHVKCQMTSPLASITRDLYLIPGPRGVVPVPCLYMQLKTGEKGQFMSCRACKTRHQKLAPVRRQDLRIQYSNTSGDRSSVDTILIHDNLLGICLYIVQ